jgi:hypothetical protein
MLHFLKSRLELNMKRVILRKGDLCSAHKVKWREDRLDMLLWPGYTYNYTYNHYSHY